MILYARIDVIPGGSTHIKLAIADAGNHFFDSNVFIKAANYSSLNKEEIDSENRTANRSSAPIDNDTIKSINVSN